MAAGVPAAPPLRHVAAAAAAVLLLSGLVAAIDSATPAFTCTPSGINAVRRALDSVGPYSYQVRYSRGASPGDPPPPVVMEGAYAGPAQVHERYSEGFSTLYQEAIRLGDERWVLYTKRWREFDQAPEAWRSVTSVVRDQVDDPRLIALPGNPARFALDGLLPVPAAFEWTSEPMGDDACMLVGEHIYSQANGARQVLAVEVETVTALPRSIENRALGFGVVDDFSRDWVISHEFTYDKAVTAIEAPDQVVEPEATPDFSEVPQPRPCRPADPSRRRD